MDVNATVDVGKNLTSLMERLAEQIGVTVDKVYPWYVQQAYLEGWTTLIALSVFTVVFSVAFVVSWRKADFRNEDRYSVLCIPLGLFLLICILGWPMEGIDAGRKMLNPNYYAMQSFTRDIGRLSGR